jgi:hypothetical protein
MSGTIPLSLTQQFDEFGAPLNGGKLYIIQAGTVNTPQDSFQDPGLTPALKLPNPITMDAAGRLPQFFLADGFIKILMTNSAGVVERQADNIQVIGPSVSGGGGGGTAVDPNALIQTGNMIARYGIGALPGYVRCNGNSIGNAGSGGTERANPDTQPLWIYLYGVDSSLFVSGGRTGNALTDYNNSKTIVVPDWRGYALGALGDMGNILGDAGRLTAAFFGANPLTLGAAGGGESFQINNANLPAYTPAGAVAIATNARQNMPPSIADSQGGTNFSQPKLWSGLSILADLPVQATYNFNGTPAPGRLQTAFNVTGPRKLCTFYMKL